MSGTRIIAVAGGICIGLALAVVGYLIAGIPGEIVGVLLAFPASVAWGMWTGRR